MQHKKESSMKKLVLALFAVVLLCGVSYAAQTQDEIIDATIAEATPALEGDCYIGDARSVAFFTTINCNRTTASVTATVTAAASVDGVNWQDISWMDTAGGVTPQTTETTTLKKQTYVGWLDNRLAAKFIRIRVQDANMYAYSNTTGDSATVTVTVVQDK